MLTILLCPIDRATFLIPFGEVRNLANFEEGNRCFFFFYLLINH